MAVDLTLNNPINEADLSTRDWLGKLQGNILRGHGRDFGVYIFFSFSDPSPETCRGALRSLAERYVTCARQQYDDTVLYRRTGLPGRLFGSLFLTAAGYSHLKFDLTHFQEPEEQKPDPGDPRVTFADGMQRAVDELGDPPVDKWACEYQLPIHAMLLLADDDEPYLGRIGADVVRELSASCTVRACERGRALRNENGDGIEHFGYVDGRSQPLFLADDFKINASNDRKAERGGGLIKLWDPLEPLERVLRPDPFGPDDDCFGSFLVFRKLEQNVRAFVARERQLADALRFTGEDRERAGALVVGRFRDGSPIAVSKTSGWLPVEDNNFNYNQDPLGQRCPLHAHIRKVNPRGDKEEDQPTTDDRTRRIARRSIAYGRRRPCPAASDALEHLPTKDVGLLFMCFQASIRRQFAFMQKRWCNNRDFLVAKVGVDPLVGQGDATVDPQQWRARYNGTEGTPFDFNGFVQLKGGEFFFAPSVAFLKNL